MRLSGIIPTLLGVISLFFISAGIGLRSLIAYAPILGFVLGIVFFLLAGKATDILRKREEREKERNKIETGTYYG